MRFFPRGTNAHWVITWTIFGGILVIVNYQRKQEDLGVIISINKESQLFVISDEDVSAASLLSLYGDNIEYFDKQDIVSNT